MNNRSLSLYIHIPFCKTICVYCNFPAFANKNSFIDQYLKSLKFEIQIKSKFFKTSKIQTIYYGGGTPSLLSSQQITDLHQSIKQNFNLNQNPEISIECNPESLTSEKLKTYQKLGINRISLGIQSLNNKTLWRIARPHNQEKAIKALQLLSNNKFPNFGIDLILGLPYQTISNYLNDLTQILYFKPTHLSTYFLSPDTEKINRIIKDCPLESDQILMYQQTQSILKQHNFIQYEISNYAKKGFECQHNINYWKQKNYLGLGLGAHSYIKDQITENTKNFSEYIKNPLTLDESFKLDPETKILDYIMLNLRFHQGINFKDFKSKFGKSALTTLKQKIELTQKIHSLIITKTNLKISPKNFIFIDQITKSLF